MRYSLINVQESSGPGNSLVSGSWLQDHIGTLATASAAARATEAANGHKIDVAVVPEINSTVPALSYWPNLPRMDVDP